MFDSALSVIRISLGVAAGALVLAVIGVANQHVPLSMAAVGDGIGDLFRWLGDLLGHI